MFKNQTHKSFTKFAVLSVMLFALGVLLNELKVMSNGVLYVYLVVVFTLQSGLYFKFFSVPLHKVTSQIAALIAGKPYKKLNLSKRDEFGLLAYFFNDVTKNVENISYYLKEGERMASELQIASDIQKSVLPVSIPLVEKMDTVAKTRSADEVGGDSFAIVQRGTDYFMYIGDVTGHGAPAGLIMMMVNTLFDVMLPMYQTTYDLAVNINKVLKPRVNSTMFMTTNFLKWDSANEVLTFTGAGHEHILIYRANEGVCEAIPAGGIALAMAEDISQIVQEKQITLNDQDVIVLYSDGITEAVNSEGGLYGLERLKESFKNHGHLANSLDIFENLSADIQAFVGDEVQNDDMTLMVLRYVKAGYVPEQKEFLVSTNWTAA